MLENGIMADFYADIGLKYYEMYVALSREFNLILVDYIFKDIWAEPNLMSDLSHPNGVGYAIMAENIYTVLEPLFINSDMLLDIVL